LYLGPVVVKPDIIIIEEIKLSISFKLIKELDIDIKVKELEFLNNKRL